MEILIYYPKTQKTKIIPAEQIEVGPGGITVMNRGSIEFFGFSSDYQITILAN